MTLALHRFPRMRAVMMGPLSFSPDNRLLVASNYATKDDFCQVFDLEGNPLATLPNPAEGNASVQGIAFSPGSDVIYTLSGHHVYKWHPKGELIGKFKVSEGWGCALAVSPEGMRVASASASRDLKSFITAFWTPEGTLIKRVASHETYCIRFSTNSQWLVSGGHTDRRVVIFDRDGREMRSFKTGRYRDSSPAHLALSPDNRFIAIANHHFKPADLAALVKRYQGHFSHVRTLVLTDDQVTRQVPAQVQAFLTDAKVDDTVIMMVSGHGGYDFSRRAVYYYLSCDAEQEALYFLRQWPTSCLSRV